MKHKPSIADLREDYRLATLDISDIQHDPIQQFKTWFEEALNAQVREPNAMVIATANAEGQPSARVVLLKDITTEGFVFYTNYKSHKAQELDINPHAALVFNWLELQRQVRIEGTVEKISSKLSEKYFQSRPKGSQIGAHASPQSQIIPDRTILEEKVAELTSAYKDKPSLPLPAHWGGYIILPKRIEFWQGRSSRLHDRILFTKVNRKWKIDRLAP